MLSVFPCAGPADLSLCSSRRGRIRRAGIVWRSVVSLMLAGLVGGGVPLATASTGAGFPAQIAKARSAWNKTSSEITGLIRNLSSRVNELNRIDRDIKARENGIRYIEADRESDLEEMLRGRFCNKCGDIASKIERTGKSFEQHLAEVRGEPIPATKEQLDGLRQKYEAKLAPLRKQLSDVRDEKRKRLSELERLRHELLVKTPVYHNQMLDERDLLAAQWAAEKQSLQNKLQELGAEVETARNSPAGPARDTRFNALRAQLDASSARAAAAEARAQQAATAFNQTVRGNMDALQSLAETIEKGQPLVDGWVIGQRLSAKSIIFLVSPLHYSRGPGFGSAVENALGPSPAKPKSTPPATQKSVKDLLNGK
ncbi:MAG: hypothetical protein C0518_08285 [Opitutus sp.]|nr:hypothetical protein [Opitutus sp.]